jgi:hypothetical protein
VKRVLGFEAAILEGKMRGIGGPREAAFLVPDVEAFFP